MSTIVNTIPKTATAQSYSKRQRYEFEIFDKSIKEIENLFKQDIHTFKRPKLNKLSTPNNIENNYTYSAQIKDQRHLDDYLKKDKRNDSYKSLFSISKQYNQHPHPHPHLKTYTKDDYHQIRDLYRKKQQQQQQQQQNKETKNIPLVHPSIINHIRLETCKKIDYYVNDISQYLKDETIDLSYNEDGLFLKNDRIISNLINIIDSSK